MNGVTDEYLYFDQPPDEDEAWYETDIECPFCRHNIEWKFDHLYCGNCEVRWEDGASVERDRAEYDRAERDEMSDADAFNRGMRIGRGL